jgi:hypothetical protein
LPTRQLHLLLLLAICMSCIPTHGCVDGPVHPPAEVGITSLIGLLHPAGHEANSSSNKDIHE